MKPYESVLSTIMPEVSFGYSTIRVYRPQELEAGQVGYSISEDGKSLIGDEDGDWRKSWIVIGYEECCGDPIFIDKAMDEYPVYTAVHGEDQWEPVCIAVSLAGFGQALSAIANLGKGRENPTALEENPLPESEKDKALASIRRSNPTAELEFWELLLESQE